MEFSRYLKKHGMTLGVYDGATKRRFVLFTTHDALGEGNVMRREFDTTKARKQYALDIKTPPNPS